MPLCHNKWAGCSNFAEVPHSALTARRPAASDSGWCSSVAAAPSNLDGSAQAPAATPGTKMSPAVVRDRWMCRKGMLTIRFLAGVSVLVSFGLASH